METSNILGQRAAVLYREGLEREPLKTLQEFSNGPETLSGLPCVPMPYFLSLDIRAQLESATLKLGEGLKDLTQRCLRGEFSDYLQQDPALEEAVKLDAGVVDPQCFWRFDFSFHPDTASLKVLECNAGDPSGMGFTDLLAKQFLSLSCMREVESKFKLHWDSLMDSQLQTVCERFGIKVPQAPIYFLIPPESSVYQDQLSMQAIYRTKFWDARVRDPRDFEWRDDRLWAGSEPVDYIVRDTTDELVLEPYRDKARPIIQAYKAGSVKIVNPFCSIVADHKSLLAILYRDYPELEQWVPETRLLLQESPNLSKDDWVLKPSFGWGGEEIVVGRDCSEQKWIESCTQAREQAGRYILQAYHALPEVEFPSYEGQEFLGFHKRHLTLSCWLHNGRFAGCFARAGADRVVNVNQGGSLMPVFFVEP